MLFAFFSLFFISISHAIYVRFLKSAMVNLCCCEKKNGKNLVPAKISHVTSGGHLQVKKGSPVRLECSATGNPAPNITWTRKNNLLPSGMLSPIPFLLFSCMHLVRANRSFFELLSKIHLIHFPTPFYKYLPSFLAHVVVVVVVVFGKSSLFRIYTLTDQIHEILSTKHTFVCK